MSHSSVDSMAMITKDSMVRLVECRASSIINNLTVACCKLDICLQFTTSILFRLALYQSPSYRSSLNHQLTYSVT